MPSHPHTDRLLVVLPSWIGDAVMATPSLRALRERFPDARITYLLKPYVRPIVDGSPWHDRLIVARPRRAGRRAAAERRRSALALVGRLRRGRFDVAVLLPNSFRSALLCALAGIGRRVGYRREGRGVLLTDRLPPAREGGRCVPTPMIDYYLGLAKHLGAASPDRRMELFTRADDDAAAVRLLVETGASGSGGPLVMLNPGAATKGDAKLWPAERFAAVADRLIESRGASVLVNGSPGERDVLDRVHAAARHPLIDLPSRGGTLRLLKSILRRCDLLITNDTGARHIGAAMGTRLVSLFGPTDPEWTRLDVDRERIVRRNDGCAACASKARTHTCMRAISADTVHRAAEDLLNDADAAHVPAG